MFKLKKGAVYIWIILLLIIPGVFATTETIMADDQWDANEGTPTDGKLWINDNIDVETTGISSQGDMICYDWDSNGQYDNCYWDTAGCGSGCNANSCNYFSIPLNMNNNWKTGCVLESACQEGVDVPERICDADVDASCNWDTSVKQENTIAAKVYYDCDNSAGQRAQLTVSPTFTWTVVDTHKYDCNDCSGCYNYNNKDYMGKYGTASWRVVSSDVSCPANKKCSEYFDDQESTTKTYTGFTNPCKWDNGQYCSLDSDCASNECVHGTCRAADPYCSDNYCDAGETYSSCPGDCCDNDCTGYADTICHSICDGYETCSFYSSSTKSACNNEYWNDKACVDANTYVTCCEGSPIDCSSGDYCSGGYCFDCSTVCDGSCQSSACYGSDPDCDSSGNPFQICCGNEYCESGESYTNCPVDCCESDCTGYGSPPENPDTICHLSCDGYNGCFFTAGCNGDESGSRECVDADTYRSCCESGTADCAGTEYCSNGNCLTCNTQCNNNCQSSACYQTDPDCDSGGSLGGYCGDAVCCQETQASCPVDCGSAPSYCNGTIEAIAEDSYGSPLSGAKVYLNSSFNGTTNIYGNHLIDITNTLCGTAYDVMVKCSDDTYCNTKISSIDASVNGVDHDSLIFDCSICLGEADIKVTDKDVKITGIKSNANITVTVHVGKISGTNLNISFTGIGQDNSKQNFESKLIPAISQNTDYTVSVAMDLSNVYSINVYVDPNSSFNEDKSNNFVTKRAIIQKKAFLYVKTGFPSLDSNITEYLETYIDNVAESENVPQIYVGDILHNDKIAVYNGLTLYTHNWGYEGYHIKVDGEILTSVYAGLIGRIYSGGKIRVMIYGEDIDGTIAAVKKFSKNLNYWLDSQESEKHEQLNELDLDAIKVYGLLHNTENAPKYKRFDKGFGDVIKQALYDQTYDTAIKLVKTINDNTTLRIKHISPEFDSNLKSAINPNNITVVLQHGIHTDLNSWEPFGKKLQADGFDSWLIEAWGGPGTDTACNPNCPNYTFSDLKTYYWPALIAGIEEYSGKTNLSYVGYDLGCTVALESLELYQDGQADIGYYNPQGDYWSYADLSSNPIDTFVGVACIGNFSIPLYYASNPQYSIFPTYINNSNIYQEGSFIYESYNGHLPGGYYKGRYFFITLLNPLNWVGGIPKVISWLLNAGNIAVVLGQPYPPLTSPPMSMKVYQDLQDWMQDPNEPKVGLNVPINNFAIIQSVRESDSGGAGGTSLQYDKDTDNFVSNLDQMGICKNVDSGNKYYLSFKNYPHFQIFFVPSIANREEVQGVIKDFLKEKTVNNDSQVYYLISNSQNCNGG